MTPSQWFLAGLITAVVVALLVGAWRAWKRHRAAQSMPATLPEDSDYDWLTTDRVPLEGLKFAKRVPPAKGVGVAREPEYLSNGARPHVRAGTCYGEKL